MRCDVFRGPYLVEAAELSNGTIYDLIVAVNLASPVPVEASQDQALQVLKEYVLLGLCRCWNRCGCIAAVE